MIHRNVEAIRSMKPTIAKRSLDRVVIFDLGPIGRRVIRSSGFSIDAFIENAFPPFPFSAEIRGISAFFEHQGGHSFFTRLTLSIRGATCHTPSGAFGLTTA
jgi:hypothetical protein